MTHLELITLNYLLNSLWQVPLIALVAICAARLARSAGPQIEHRIWVAALILEAALPACDFAPTLRSIFLSLMHTGPGNVTTQITVLNAATAQAPSKIAAVIASASLVIYIVAVIYLTTRLLYRLHRTRALRHTSQLVTLAGEPLTIWQRCARFFSVHDAQLATSATIAVPSTIGIRRRIVLLPPTLLTDLPHEDLAAALAHEFAHMSRHDFAKNLLYELIALPIAFHPLLWLTRRRIAESREIVCDDLAAQATQGATRYAHSLLRLAASFSQPTPAATLHTIGILDTDILERRVMTLTSKNRITATSRRAAIIAAFALGIATCASAMSLRLQVPVSAILSTRTVAPAHALIAPGAQQADHPLKVRGSIIAGQLISKVDPVYPPIARAAHVGGTVLLHAIIGKDGRMQQLSLISGPPMLVGSAIDAVRQWVYQPFLLNGDPVEVDTTITVNFTPDGKNAPPPPPPGTVPEPTGSIAGVYNVGGDVNPPVVIHTVDPVFTEAARRDKVSGNVVVSLIVDSSGMPQNVRVERGLGDGLDEKAIESVQQYRFKPATRDGEPVAANLMVQVNFEIF